MTFEELGASLRAEREKRGLRLDDAANKLKINPRQLRALENGDMAALPHAAYARGFIRSYANWLGWSAEEIQEALANFDGAPAKPARKREQEYLEMPDKPVRSSHKGLVFIVILLLLLGGGYWAYQEGKLEWMFALLENRGQTEAPLQTADSYMAEKDAALARQNSESASLGRAAETSAEPTKPYALPVPDNLPADLPASPAPAPALEPKSYQPDETETKPAPVAEAEKIAEQNEAAQESAPDHHKLVISAIEECWVHSNADKTDTRQFSLRRGDTFALTFTKSLELKLGNAGGVRLRYDGEDLPPPGSSGQVRTLVFPPKDSQ